MSLILDALKKLDREKASRRKGMPDLAAEVLRTDPAQPRKRVPMYLLAVFFTALATAGITYAIIVKPGFLPKSPPPSAGIPPAPGKQVASASPETGTQAKPSAPVVVIPPAPGQKDSPTPPVLDSPAKSSPPAPTTPPASPKKREAASAKSGTLSKPSPPAPVSPAGPRQRVGAVSPKPSAPAKPSPGTSASPSASVEKVPPAPPESGVSANHPLPARASPESGGRSPLLPSPEPPAAFSGANRSYQSPVQTDSRPLRPPRDKMRSRRPPGRQSASRKSLETGEPVAGSSRQIRRR
jgi:hypothetical protein